MNAQGRLDGFYAPYRADGWGAPAFHPVMMLKVLLYGYTNGVTSSRRSEAMLEMDIAFRYLAANNQPDSRTINGFRTTHLEAILGLFMDVLELCRDAGMVNWGGWRWTGTGLRGKKKAGLEWSLWCTTHNLLKLWRHAMRTRGAVCPARPRWGDEGPETRALRLFERAG